MTDSRTVARLVEQQLRVQASAVAAGLAGRSQSAARLDELFHALVLCCRPALSLEIGAFDASVSRRIKRDLPACRVIAVEASPVNFQHHRDRVDFDAVGIEYTHAAVVDRPGTVTLPIAVDPVTGEPELTGNTSVHGSPMAADVVDHLVPGTTVDALAADAEGSVVLWVDVEGAVGPVLAGGAATLPRVDVMKVEVEDAMTWPGQEMVAVDVIESLLAVGLVPVARDIEYSGQYNLLLLSDRAMRLPGVLERVERHHRDEAHLHAREPGRLRSSPALRGLLRPLRRRVTRRS